MVLHLALLHAHAHGGRGSFERPSNEHLSPKARMAISKITIDLQTGTLIRFLSAGSKSSSAEISPLFGLLPVSLVK
jgi:hypothetical protein